MTAQKSIASAQENGNGRLQRRRFSSLLLHLSALLLFVLFFVGTALMVFPKAQLRDYVVDLIHRQTGQRISIGQLSFSPLLRVQAKEIAWQPPNGSWPPVVVDRLSLSPSWISLFGKNPAGRFQAAVAGGTVDGRYARNGSCDAKLGDVSIAPFIGARFPFPPTGKISGSVALEKTGKKGEETVVLDLEAADLKVGGLGPLGLAKKDLALGRLQLRGKMIGTTFKLETLKNEGGDLSLTGHGSILVSNVPSRSRFNLQFELRPTPALASSLHDLLQLTGLKSGPDGNYKFRLAGTPVRPILR